MQRIILIFLVLLLYHSCRKDSEFDYPLIFTGEVSNINSNGANFNAKIVDLGKDRITEFGFVWDSTPNPEIINSDKFIINQDPKTGIYEQRIYTTLKEGVIYYVKAFIKTSSYISYGKKVKFTSLGSLAPEILDFSPKNGNIDDTLLVLGKNFSYITSNNSVKFGDFESQVIKASQDSLFVIVPHDLNVQSSQISVSLQGNRSYSNDKFNLIPPIITKLLNKTGTYGSHISIEGSNFLSNKNSLNVFLDKYYSSIIEIDNNNIISVVPDSLNIMNAEVKVCMNNLISTSTENFQLDSVILYDFTPKKTYTGWNVTLTGTNFSPIRYNNLITIGGIITGILQNNVNEIVILIPHQNNNNFPSRNVVINVEVAGVNYQFNDTLLLNDEWFRLNDAPFSKGNLIDIKGFKNASSFTFNNKAYIGLNNSSELWEYDPANETWKRLSDFPGTSRESGCGFLIGNYIFFGTGYGNNMNLKDWWQYDIYQDVWTQKNDFSGDARTGAVAFQINNQGYLGTGVFKESTNSHNGYLDFWKYTPSQDKWIMVTEYPMDSCCGIWNGIAKVVGDDVYIGLGNNKTSILNSPIYKYNAIANSWQKIKSVPYAYKINWPLGFVINDQLYVKTINFGYFFRYNPTTDNWIQLNTTVLTDIDNGIGFDIDGKGYAGLGTDNSMWEYDPSL